MRCYICEKDTDKNYLRDVPDDFEETVVDHYGLIHCIGPEDQFDHEGWVALCKECAYKPLTILQLLELEKAASTEESRLLTLVMQLIERREKKGG